jgi:phosphoglycerate dehydrogenase-like enzyme
MSRPREESLPCGQPFWTTEELTVLPHIGGLHPAHDEIVAGLFVDNVKHFLKGLPLRALVDCARGY